MNYSHIGIFAVIVIVIVIVVALAQHLCRQKAAPTAPPSTEQVEGFMIGYANEAVDIAKDMGITLDFSETSIKHVDDALEKVRQEYLKTKKKEGVWGLSIMFGAYIGEVMRRGDRKAYWLRDHPSVGEATFPLFLGADDNCVFPTSWCYKRILNGSEDNVVSKFRFTREDMQKLQSERQPE